MVSFANGVLPSLNDCASILALLDARPVVTVRELVNRAAPKLARPTLVRALAWMIKMGVLVVASAPEVRDVRSGGRAGAGHSTRAPSENCSPLVTPVLPAHVRHCCTAFRPK